MHALKILNADSSSHRPSAHVCVCVYFYEAQSLYRPLVYQRIHLAGVDFWSRQHKRGNTCVYSSLVCG